MEYVHTYNGVCPIPMKNIWDFDRGAVSAGRLSKKIAHLKYEEQKPLEIGLSVAEGLHGRAGDCLGLENTMLMR